jgi:hypothetical protein
MIAAEKRAARDNFSAMMNARRTGVIRMMTRTSTTTRMMTIQWPLETFHPYSSDQPNHSQIHGIEGGNKDD